MNLKDLFQKLWEDYATVNPQAKQIHALLEKRGELVLNDHVAFRTYRSTELGLEKLAKVFEKNGYVAKGDYFFKVKKLYAKHYEHSDKTLPKVFISELILDQCSPTLQSKVKSLIEQCPKGFGDSDNFCFSGRPWKATYADYVELEKESEYAAWMSVFGFRANHFTVNVNALKTFKGVEDLNSFLKDSGFKLNASGGEIKGTTADYLEQSSTMAAEVPVEFSDGKFTIPSCYYEFAKRYTLPSGELYQGFVEKSADKIFESTNRAGM